MQIKKLVVALFLVLQIKDCISNALPGTIWILTENCVSIQNLIKNWIVTMIWSRNSEINKLRTYILLSLDSFEMVAEVHFVLW